MINLGFAITGSFCTFERILIQLRELVAKGYNVLPIFSFSALNTDTRFYKAREFYDEVVSITGNTPVDSLVAAEPIGPNNLIDVLVIAPCTGNTLGKLAGAITDTPVTMVAKAHMRNNKPIVIGISTNDALGFNLRNIASLLVAKGVYFVPFGQDDPHKKPRSLICNMEKIEETVLKAMKGEQIQPLLTK